MPSMFETVFSIASQKLNAVESLFDVCVTLPFRFVVLAVVSAAPAVPVVVPAIVPVPMPVTPPSMSPPTSTL